MPRTSASWLSSCSDGLNPGWSLSVLLGAARDEVLTSRATSVRLFAAIVSLALASALAKRDFLFLQLFRWFWYAPKWGNVLPQAQTWLNAESRSMKGTWAIWRFCVNASREGRPVPMRYESESALAATEVEDKMKYKDPQKRIYSLPNGKPSI